MFALVVTFYLSPDSKANFNTLLEDTMKQITANEPETFLYIPHYTQDDKTHVVLYELYKNQEAFEYHESQPYIQDFLKERQKYFLKEPSVQFLQPLAGQHVSNNSSHYGT